MDLRAGGSIGENIRFVFEWIRYATQQPGWPEGGVRLVAWGAEAYALGYVESLNDARTLLVDYLQHPIRSESRRGGDEGRVSPG